MNLATINMLWIGPALRRLENTCLQSFLDVGHPVHLYTYAPVANVPEGVELCDGREILPENRIFVYQRGSGRGSPAAFANLFRYRLLFEKGGWWADTDVFCLRPWLFSADHVLVAEPGLQLLHNGIMRAPQHSKLAHSLYQRANAYSDQELNWGDTGARLLTMVARELEKEVMLDIRPSADFCPIPWQRVTKVLHTNQLPASVRNAYGVHLFHEMWRRRGLSAQHAWGIYSQLETLRNEVCTSA